MRLWMHGFEFCFANLDNRFLSLYVALVSIAQMFS